MASTHGLIGLYAPAPQSGKTTAAMMVMEELDASSTLLPFAYPLKLATAALLEQMGLTDAEATHVVEDAKDEPIEMLGGRTAREFLLKVGNDCGRDFARSDVWVRRHEQLSNMISRDEWVIADDVRFANEAGNIKERGGYLVRLVNPRVHTPPSASEGALENLKFDHEIVNDGTIPQLRLKVRDMLVRLGAPVV